MKVAVIIDHLKNGGAERVVSVLSDELVRLGHDVYIIVTIDERNYHLNSKIKYHVARGESIHPIFRRIKRLNSLKKIILDTEPDVIYSFGYYMNLYTIFANRSNIPLIISERNDPERELSSVLFRLIRNKIYQKAAMMICQTTQAEDYYKKRIDIPIKVIPNPVEKNLPEKWEGPRTHEIVTACRIEKQKNLPMMVRAFEKLHRNYPDYILKIFGDGSQKKQIEKLIAELNLEEAVVFPGFSKTIHEDIRDAAMYVSSSDYEGISNSMLEALALGIPTICTDCPVGGAALAIKDHENGLLVRCRDIDGLYHAMKKIISDPELATRIGDNATLVRETFSVKKIIKGWIEAGQFVLR